jgi:hypothetical protein
MKSSKKKNAGKGQRLSWPVSAKTILTYIQGDFEKLWDAAIGFDGGKGAGGNYHFASFSILFLEWVCRLGKSKSGLLAHFAEELNKIDERYFTKISNRTASISGEFKIPKPAQSGKGTFLIDLIYVQIRNGHSHVYHQNVAALKNGGVFGFGIQMEPIPCTEIGNRHRDSINHLKPFIDGNQMVVSFCPALFYSDIKRAAEIAKIVEIQKIFEIPMVSVLSDVDIGALAKILSGEENT